MMTAPEMSCACCRYGRDEFISIGMVDRICTLFPPHSIESHRGFMRPVPRNCPALTVALSEITGSSHQLALEERVQKLEAFVEEFTRETNQFVERCENDRIARAEQTVKQCRTCRHWQKNGNCLLRQNLSRQKTYDFTQDCFDYSRWENK